MKRLTERTKAGTPNLKVECEKSKDQIYLSARRQLAIDRLAAYEDIGTVEELTTLAKARDDGRVVVLPCRGQTMNDDLIGRSALLQWFEPFKAIKNAGIPQLIEAINVQPAIDVTPVVHGQWEDVPQSDVPAHRCSECGKVRYGSRVLPYCPHCGAKMDAEEERP